MPICPPCADAADFETQLVAAQDWVDPAGHQPEICRDFGRAGCPCQHRPVSTTTRED